MQKSNELNQPRIFLGFEDTCGYLGKLAKGLRELGVTADVWLYQEDVFMPDQEPKSPKARLFQHICKFRLRQTGMARHLGLVTEAASRFILLCYSLLAYDCFLFTCNTSFFRMREFPLLRLLGKKVFVVCQGTDTRPPYINGIWIAGDDRLDTESLVVSTSLMKANVKYMERYANEIICQAATSQLFSRPVVRYLAVGIPTLSPDLENSNPGERSEVVVIHAPSRPLQKGSHIFDTIIERLRDEGLKIRYVKLTNTPNSKVMEHLANCDLVLDQAYCDTPFATLACEAASFGKPAVVGGHYAQFIGSEYEGKAIPLDHFCDPSELYGLVKSLVIDSELRERLGKQAYSFISTEWTYRRVAERYLAIFQDQIPDSWRFNPAESDYLFGWGASKEDITNTISSIVRTHDEAALKLDGKVTLIQVVRDLVKGSDSTPN